MDSWISVGIAVLALFISAWGLRDARQAHREAGEIARRDREDRQAKAARQIDVYWGHDRSLPGREDSFAVVVRNRGDETVYDFRAETEALPYNRALTMKVVPPGWWRARYHPNDPDKPLGFGYVKPANPESFSLARDDAHSIREYSFKDAGGVKWRSVGGEPPRPE